MATRYKNSVNDTGVPGWVGGVVPTNNDLAAFDSQIGALTQITLSTAAFPGGSFAYLSSTPATDFYFGTTVSSTAFSMNQKLAGPSGPDNLYTVYIAPNKTFSYDGSFRALNDASDYQPIIFVDTGAGIVLNKNASDSVLGAIGSESVATPFVIEKRGEGWVLTGRGVTPAAFNQLFGKVQIRQGEVRLDGGRTATAGYTSPLGNAATEFSALGGSTPTLRFATTYSGVTTFGRADRTVTTGATFTTAGTITVDSGFTATMQGAFTGSGTFTKDGAGTLSLTGTSLAMPLVLTSGTVQLGASANFTGSTLSGTGTLAMNSGSLGSGSTISASGHTGTITGNCSISGGVSTFGSQFTGTVSNISSGIIDLTGTSTGGIASIGFAIINLTGSFSAAGTTALAGAGVNPATVNISGAGAGFSNRTLTMASNSKLTLANGASAANTITANVDTSTVTLEVPNATTATYSGTFSTNQASGSVKVQALAGGTLILSGGFTSSNAGRTFALNNDAGYAGTLKATGAGFTGAAATLSRGTLHIAGSTNKNIGTTLTVVAGATMAHSPDVPVTLTGNLALAANSTFRFGAPA